MRARSDSDLDVDASASKRICGGYDTESDTEKAASNYAKSSTLIDLKMKHKKGSSKAPTSNLELGTRYYIEFLAD